MPPYYRYPPLPRLKRLNLCGCTTRMRSRSRPDHQPSPPLLPLYSFSFSVIDGETGTALAGAVFTVRKYSMRIACSASDQSGSVQFNNILSSHYSLEQTSSPPSYKRDATMYPLTVEADGQVTIGSIPAENFLVENLPSSPAQSPPPFINRVVAGDAFVIGTGVPHGTVVMTFANGSETCTTVGEGSLWSIPVPAEMQLAADDALTAYQQCTHQLQSDLIVTFVSPSN